MGPGRRTWVTRDNFGRSVSSLTSLVLPLPDCREVSSFPLPCPFAVMFCFSLAQKQCKEERGGNRRSVEERTRRKKRKRRKQVHIG